MKDNCDLLIIGTGGLAKEIGQLARIVDPCSQIWNNIYYVAEHIDEIGLDLPYGIVKYCDSEIHFIERKVDVIVGIGNPVVRRKVADRLSLNKYFSFPNLIHPQVDLDYNYVIIGKGNIIAKGVVITCDVKIGDFNLLNWNATVGHDVSIGSFNVINPNSNISGRCYIEDACLIGAGSFVLEGLCIASDVKLGAGSVLLSSVYEPGSTFVGVPALRVKK